MKPPASANKIPQPTRAREKPEAAEVLTPQRIRQNAFLRALERCPIISTAALQVGIARETHYDWLQDDPTYRGRYQEALKAAGDALEEKALELCYGWDEPVYHEGKVCGSIRRYDTRHIRDMLRAARPDKYRERHELTGKDGTPLFPVDAIREYMRQQKDDEGNEDAQDGPSR